MSAYYRKISTYFCITTKHFETALTYLSEWVWLKTQIFLGWPSAVLCAVWSSKPVRTFGVLGGGCQGMTSF